MKNVVPASQRIAAFGITKTVSEWIQDAMCQVGETELRMRLGQGWSAEKAITARSSSNGGKLSRFKGVTWHKHANKWMAQIRHEGELHQLGYFDDEVLAAKAYDRKAVELKGVDAECNFDV